MHGSLTQELLGSSPDLRFIRQGVSWDEYERILAENAWNGSPRFTFDRGMLEIARFTPFQEETNRTLAFIVNLAASALHIAFREFGATTYRRPDLLQGFEPDASFYIQNASRIAGRGEIELPLDPPPDLVIDLATRDAFDRLPLFAAFGVPEVWRYEEADDRVLILRLVHGDYHRRRESAALVPLTSDLLTRLVRDSRAKPSYVWPRELESWLQTYD